MSPRRRQRRPASLVGALDESKTPEAPSIHELVNNQSSATAPSLGSSSEGSIDPWVRPSVFSAPCIHVGVLISHSRSPQHIYQRCRRPKRPLISSEGVLLYTGHRWRPSDLAPLRYQVAPSWGCPPWRFSKYAAALKRFEIAVSMMLGTAVVTCPDSSVRHQRSPSNHGNG